MTGVEGIDPAAEAAARGEDAAPGSPDEADGVAEVAPRRRTGMIVSGVVAVVAIAFLWVLATREPAADRVTDSPLIGRVAPVLQGQTLDGDTFDLDDHQGRWVVVNIFATWCVPCRQEHPELDTFDRAHERAGDVRLVSVLYDDEPDDAREFFQDNGGEWPVVLDEGGRAATAWSVSGVPETYLVAPNGRVAAKLVGGVTSEGLDDLIARIERGDVEEGS